MPFTSDPQKTKHIFIIAGEASGDIHASHLVEAIKRKQPSWHFSGLGGEHLKNAGVQIYEDLTQMAFIGVWDVLIHFPQIKAIFDRTIHRIKSSAPDAVILVDYPGFNLRLAKKIKKMGIKVIYYISPQVWAWKKKRVFFIQKYTDRMMVFFNFEKDFYAQFGITVDYVGHPLVDMVKPAIKADLIRQKLSLLSDRLTVGLLPGSRHKEIESLLDPMLAACRILKKNFSWIQFVLVKAPTISREHLESHLKNYSDLHAKISEEGNYNSINACDVCVVASGTATLEVALLEKPMVIIYKTNFLTYILGKILINIKFLGLPNIIAGKSIVTELIQNQANPPRIAAEIRSIVTDEIKIAGIKSELKNLKHKLDQGGAAERAADIVIKTILSEKCDNVTM
ncbi:MAG: lipid-A-disaccharide synthase [Candidatus Omnitrophica bacterium]|nr:lipid-A-disaccharide synthase [Candidatus Omnitrophota bacterium]